MPEDTTPGTPLARRTLSAIETASLIGVGGFAGANLRHLVSTVLPGLPGTLLVNAAGSLLLGFVLYEAVYAGVLARETRVVVATGFLSSLTTYSTFAVQTMRASPVLAVGNVLANYALGFAGVLVGRWLAGGLDAEVNR